MSSHESRQAEQTAQTSPMTKRQQMKIQQAVRLIESQENQKDKSGKRKAQHPLEEYAPSNRKLFKPDNSPNSIQDDDNSSPEQKKTRAAKDLKEIEEDHEKYINEKYQLPDGQTGLYDYLLTYVYEQEQKRIEMEQKDYSYLKSQQLRPLKLNVSEKTVGKVQYLQQKFKELRDKMKEPFSKTHREMLSKMKNKQFWQSK